MNENEVLNILRNPYGVSKQDKEDARLIGADLIEHYKEAYINMKEWAEENGINITTTGHTYLE